MGELRKRLRLAWMVLRDQAPTPTVTFPLGTTILPGALKLSGGVRIQGSSEDPAETILRFTHLDSDR